MRRLRQGAPLITEPEKNDANSGETPKAVHGGGNVDELPVVTQYHKA
ncbi:hypothetical protein A2U01_0109453 [Trifolium medium]|uniref:Uncharacterized protein n=1 Tax=Trifolium medium TaxID=97028 RepID=A0A392VJT1_9FABA|nr:hypothetical protein [Trifolium medium]